MSTLHQKSNQNRLLNPINCFAFLSTKLYTKKRGPYGAHRNPPHALKHGLTETDSTYAWNSALHGSGVILKTEVSITFSLDLMEEAVSWSSSLDIVPIEMATSFTTPLNLSLPTTGCSGKSGSIDRRRYGR